MCALWHRSPRSTVIQMNQRWFYFHQIQNVEMVSSRKTLYITNCLSHVYQPFLVSLTFSALETWSRTFVGLRKGCAELFIFPSTLRLGSVNLQVVVLQPYQNTARVDSRSNASEVRTVRNQHKRGRKFSKVANLLKLYGWDRWGQEKYS
jgi:hypothetical protein